MKLKILGILIMLSLSCMAQNQPVRPPGSGGGGGSTQPSAPLISFPSTYKYIQHFTDDDWVPEVVSYFIFNSANNVIWCVESSDGYLFAIAYGKYNSSNKTIRFSNDISGSSFGAFYEGDVTFNLKKEKGQLKISTNNDSAQDYLGGKNVWRKLEKLKTSIKPSSALVGTSWEFTDDEANYNGELHFTSASELFANDGPHSYILIGDKVGILTGDNPKKEAGVGDFKNGKLRLHRSGFRKYLNYPWFELQQVYRDSIAASPVDLVYGGVDFVDLGLPSGILWAANNLGYNDCFDNGEGNGCFYPWNFTNPIEVQTLNEEGRVIESHHESPLEFILGENCFIPNKEVFEELLYYCKSGIGYQGDQFGAWYIGPNGNSIFFPAAGGIDENGDIYNENIIGYYWLAPSYSTGMNPYAFIIGKDRQCGEISPFDIGLQYQQFPIRPVFYKP